MSQRFDDATARQVQAADPGASTWLSANAGSGKTRVLTDRVARLLLQDVPPQNILCLTYTKAAASEMQNRLFRRLGEWAMLEDLDLRKALAQLGIDASLDTDTLARARRLFARAIETPGGLKIQTIHSFCAGLLRRFPLEAGVSPGFTELDDEATRRLQMDVLDDLAEKQPEVFSDMATLIGDADLTSLASEINAKRTLMPTVADRNATLAMFDLPAGATEDSVWNDLAKNADTSTLAQIADTLATESKTMVELSALLRQVVADGMTPELVRLLSKKCLYASGEMRGRPKPSALTKKAREALGPLADDFDGLGQALADARQALMALEAARKTLILHRFGAAFLPEYARRKDEGGWLDFDDQIEKAEALLAREGVAEWVLYKLDGAIDHVLVDEAQDTSPLQWRVIEHLTREFTSGTGSAESGERSIFVVGDLKQSIYSFQGADPERFVQMQRQFAERLAHIDLSLQQLELQYSFRSSGEILSAVDCTFGPDNTKGLGNAVEHIAFKGKLPGRVDLWPVIEPTEKPAPRSWTDPIDMVSDEHHTVQLAEQVAAQARQMVDAGFLWEEKDGGYVTRAINAGDILILVQGRGSGAAVSLFHEIIRACKTVGLDVAGADVLKLGEELAVRDILSVLSFLATPEDDLALAEALRSPLLGWSEASLYDLAANRDGAYLWEAMRNRQVEFAETFASLSDLRDASDFERPYDLIERLLTRHDGRRRLVARLGEEASDGVDALLAQALAYEQREVPSLTGFLARMAGADVNVKRRAEGRGEKLRVMTVHGSKGLESPIVILPDSGYRKAPYEFRGKLLPSVDCTPVWATAKDASPEVSDTLKQAAIDKRLEESQRLLYVAMTRAEQWLVVAAAGDLGKKGETWYEQVQRGMQALAASEHEFSSGRGLRLQSPMWVKGQRPVANSHAKKSPPDLPAWLDVRAGDPVRPPGTLSPSDLGGEKALGGETGGAGEEAAMLRGTRIHLLLEHLPGIAAADRESLAERLLPDVAPGDVAPLLDEANRVLNNPDLAFLFSGDALSEVDVSAFLPELGGARIHGAIDRLQVTATKVLAVDFKTNAIVPDTPEQVPEGLLRQMGAYASALKQIFPDHQVETAILWTVRAQLMPLAPPIVHGAVSGVSVP